MFEKVLVANRGEIAVRVMRACKELGAETVGIYSDTDRDAGHVRYADEAYHVGPARAADSYLDMEAILAVAREAEADAIHPGYGFLAENVAFARAVEETDGLTWVGPTADAMERLGEKTSARRVMADAGVPIVPGTTEPVDSVDAVEAFGDEHGYPIAIKAEGGGGGRGMKVVYSPEEIEDQLDAARREGEAYFSNDSVYVERYLDGPRHVEVQILADNSGTVRHLGERDCTLQRRHQKIIEEGPSTRLDDDLRQRIAEAATAGIEAAEYTNACTVEFLVVDDAFYFLEVNTRIQVEHTVTEELTGIDIVKWQLRIAAGNELDFEQTDVSLDGHAMEFRINAENAAQGFTPETGSLTTYRPPAGLGVRVDDALAEGDRIGGEYDSMIAKLIVHASDRDECLDRSRRALEDFEIDGLVTVVPVHRLMLDDETFVENVHTTDYLDTELDETRLDAAQQRWGTRSERGDHGDDLASRDFMLEIDGKLHDVTLYWDGSERAVDAMLSSDQVPESTSAVSAGEPDQNAEQANGEGSGSSLENLGTVESSLSSATTEAGYQVTAEMQGTILSVAVDEGDDVESGDVVCVLEAMKMENDVITQHGGTVTDVAVDEGETVDIGDLLLTVE